MKRSFRVCLTTLLVTFILIAGSALAYSLEDDNYNDTKGHWAQTKINKWKNNGFVSGYSDNSFRPEKSVTRAEFVALLNRALSFNENSSIDSSSFLDVSSTSWYYEDVNEAVSAGYIYGYSNDKFAPEQPISRQDASVICGRYLNISEYSSENSIKSFADEDEISIYAKASVKALADIGIVNGRSNNRFAPLETISRAETVTLLDNILEVVNGNSGLTGQVYFDSTPVSNCAVIISEIGGYDANYKTLTNEIGMYSLDLPVGVYNLVTRVGDKVAFESEVVVHSGGKTFNLTNLKVGQKIIGCLTNSYGNPLNSENLYFKTNPYFDCKTDDKGSFELYLPTMRKYEMYCLENNSMKYLGDFTTENSLSSIDLGEIKPKKSNSTKKDSSSSSSTDGYGVVVTVNPVNTGDIVGEGNYSANSNVSLLAEPSLGYKFLNWSINNESVSSSELYTFKMNNSKIELTANFVEMTEDDYLDDIDEALKAVEIEYSEGDRQEGVTKNLVFPISGLNNTSISWTSENQSIISNSGVVSRPEKNSVELELTAKATLGNYFKTKVIKVKVVKDHVDEVLSDNSIEDIASLNGGNTPNIEFDLNTNVPRIIDGKFTTILVECPQDSIKSLNSVKTIMSIENPEEEFTWESTSEVAGISTYRLNQVHNGMKVYGKDLTVTANSDSETTSLSGNYDNTVRDAEISLTPSVSQNSAESSAIASKGANYQVFNSELMILSTSEISPRLAWKVNVYGIESDDSYYEVDVFVDAHSGEIIKSFVTSRSADVDSEGTGVLGDEKEFTTFKRTVPNRGNPYIEYQLFDSDKNIKTYTANDSSNMPGTLVKNRDNIWDDPAAVDAHAHTSHVYNYYLNVLGRDSLDDRGMLIKSTVHFRKDTSEGFDNAYWTSSKKQFVYGDGKSKFKELSAGLDIVGHEYTHGVVSYSAGLVYEKQSGALNESYADIMGNLIEGKDDPNWYIGEDVIREGRDVEALRSLSDPNEFKSPDSISGKYFRCILTDANSDNDYGGVHRNSTIVGRAAYLIWKNGIKDKELLSQMWYLSLLKLSSDASYIDCRNAVLSAAKDLDFSNTDIDIIEDAFDSVNIRNSPNDIESNAWYYRNLMKCLNEGLIVGYDDGTVKPTKIMTKAEYIKTLALAYQYDDKYVSDSGCPDAWKSHWAKNSLLIARGKGWIDSNLDPDETITREEAGHYLWEAYKTASSDLKDGLDLVEYDESSFDSPGKGMSSPIGIAKNQSWDNNEAFTDQDSINDKYEESIYQLYMNGVYQGYPDKSFKASESLDRATCCSIIIRTFK